MEKTGILKTMKIHQKNTRSIISNLILLLIFSTSIPGVYSKPVCYGKLDLVFVIDASYSIADGDFTEVKSFVKLVYNEILDNIRLDLRAGAVFYASELYEPPFKLTNNQEEFLQYVEILERMPTNVRTNTGDALKRALKIFTDAPNPDPKSVQMMVLITDGESQDPADTRVQAALIAATKVKVVAIGHGNEEQVDVSELRAVATSEDMVKVMKKINTEYFIEETLKMICAKTQDNKPDSEVPRDSLKFDLYFLLDESNAVKTPDFNIVKEFVKWIVNTFELGGNYARVGVIKYGLSTMRNSAHSIGILDDNDHESLVTAINRLTRNPNNGGARSVLEAFKYLDEMMDDNTAQDRPVIVVLQASGLASNDREALINKARAYHSYHKTNPRNPRVFILVVGTGRDEGDWSSQRNYLAYSSNRTSWHTPDYIGIAGNDQASRDRRDKIREVIKEIGAGTFVTAGSDTGRWGGADQAFDFIILVDGSKRMRSALEFAIVKFVIKQLINDFKLHTEMAAGVIGGGRVGIMLYDQSGVYYKLALGGYSSRDDLNDKIDALKVIERTEYADNARAIAAMRVQMAADPRESAAKLALMITMSTSDDLYLAEAQAKAAAGEGIQLMSLAIGGGASTQEMMSFQMFDKALEPPAIHTDLQNLGTTKVLAELQNDIKTFAAISRPIGRSFTWSGAKFDLIFLLHDQSGAVNGGRDAMNWLSKVTAGLPIGSDKVQVGVIQFGTGVSANTNKQIILGNDGHWGSLASSIYQLDIAPSGGANMKAALGAMNAMFANNGRAGVPKVAIILLDGDITVDEELLNMAQTARQNGYYIAGIGVGNTKTLKLKQLVYDENGQLAYLMPSWTGLWWSAEMDASIISLSNGQFKPKQSGDILRLDSVCEHSANIMFLIDCSGSITSIFEDVKFFTAVLMSGLQPKIGFLGFASTVLDSTVQIVGGAGDTYVELYIKFIEKMKQNPSSSLTDTYNAIRDGKDMLKSLSGDKIMIVITDGKSDNRALTVQAANAARVEDINMFAIGVGDQVDKDELKLIAGSDDSVFLLTKEDLSNTLKLEDIQEAVCVLARPGDCLAGHYRDESWVCKECGLGSYQSDPEQLSCTACDPGMTTPSTAQTSSFSCYFPAACGKGTYLLGIVCKLCDIGQYQPEEDQTSCETCPADRPITEKQGATSLDQCKAADCHRDMDIVFVVDATASIGAENFNNVKVLLINTMDKFNIGLDHTRVSLSRIGDVTNDEDATNLTDSTSFNKVTIDVMTMRGQAGTTNTASALNKGITRMAAGGRYNTDPVIPKIFYIITDGISDKPSETRYEAERAKQLGNTILALGIGSNVNKPELDSLVSDDAYLKIQTDYSALPTLDIYTDICKAAKEYQGPDSPTQAAVCDVAMDVLLIMDLSESVTPSQVNFMKAKLMNLVNSFPTTDIRVGVISYSGKVHESSILALTQLSNKAFVLGAIMGQSKTGSTTGTLTGGALKKGSEMLLADMPNSGKTIVLITDGLSTDTDQTKDEARKAEDAGIFILAIGFGPQTNYFLSELRTIASTGTDAIITVNDLADLDTNLVKEKICPDTYVCSYKLDVTYIWHISDKDKAAKFSTDMDKRFADVRARLLDVKADTPSIDTLKKALEYAQTIYNTDDTTDTFRHIVILTDQQPTSVQDLLALTNTLRAEGIKITVVDASGTKPSTWNTFANRVHALVNFVDTFAERIIQTSICQEPCPSGQKINNEGVCIKCSKDTYRDKDLTYGCTGCPAGTSTTADGATSQADCKTAEKCSVAMDLVFVVNNIEALDATDRSLLETFFTKLTDKFPVGLEDEDTRLALVTDAGHTRLVNSESNTKLKVEVIRLVGDETSDDMAALLFRAKELLKNEGRDKSKYFQAMVVATAGESNNLFQTLFMVSESKRLGIYTLAIGVGSEIKLTEIEAIATDTDSKFTFSNARALFDSDSIHDKICEAAAEYKKDADSGTPDTGIVLGDCATRMDLVFLVDGSGSISAQQFLDMQIFINNFVNRFNIGPNQIRVGLIVFSNIVHESDIFWLVESVSLQKVIAGVFAQKVSGTSGTRTDLAFTKMVDMFEKQGRPDSSFVAIVLTDGKSDNSALTIAAANNAKNKGIHLAIVGFGNAFVNELYSYTVDQKSVIVVDKFSELKTDDLLKITCAYDYKCDAAMSLIVIWDVADKVSIEKLQIFRQEIQESFSNAEIDDVFVDNTDAVDVGKAVERGVQQHLANTNTHITRAILIVTDKQTITTAVKDKLETVTTTAKNNGILVTIVDMNETPIITSDIASNSKQHYVTAKFHVLPYSLVIKRSLCQAPCASGKQLSLTGDKCDLCAKGFYRDAGTSFRCQPCLFGQTTKQTGSTSSDRCLVGKCEKPMDIVMVVDESESISALEFMLLKAFLTNLASDFDYGEDAIRLGIVPYTKEVVPNQILSLHAGDNRQTVMEAISRLSQYNSPGVGTNTARGIEEAALMFSDPDNGGRQGATWMILVLTDGNSDNTYRTVAESGKAQGKEIVVYVVGVGQGNNVFVRELQQTASDPTSISLFSSFTELVGQQNFISRLCEDKYICPAEIDIIIFQDTNVENARVVNFIAKIRDSYSNEGVIQKTFNGLPDLKAKINTAPTALQTIMQSPAKTKLFLIITKMDIDDADTKAMLATIRNAGGIISFINANKDLNNNHLLSVVSGKSLLIESEVFDTDPSLGFLKRKLCISPCMDGYERRPDGECALCELGWYRDADKSHKCTSCDSGDTTVTKGATSSDFCILDCGPGAKTEGGVCKPCIKGTYQPDKFQTVCIPCGTGKTTLTTATTSQEQCLANCGSGNKLSADKMSCVTCPADTYQDQPLQSLCISCPFNLGTDEVTGVTSLDVCNDKCDAELDVILLMDASMSISPLEFTLMKAFCANTVAKFKIGPVRFGIITFADEVIQSPIFTLDQSITRDAVLQACGNLIRGSKPGTKTDAAITQAAQQFEVHGRTSAARRIVLITDGNSDDTEKTIAAARTAKGDLFVDIKAIGVGDGVHKAELNAVATEASSVKLFETFFDLTAADILPLVCSTGTYELTCKESMDIFYIKKFADSAKFNTFKTDWKKRYENEVLEQLSDSSTSLLVDDIALLTDVKVDTNPERTKSLVILTDQPNTEGSSIADGLKLKGVNVAVVYISDDGGENTFNDVASRSDLIFKAPDFDQFPMNDFILSSLCITPCGDGKERNSEGGCDLCDLGEYRTSTASHMCAECTGSQTTPQKGATSSSQCQSCSVGQWQCANGDCIDLTDRCDDKNDCSDNSDEICNDCTAGQRYDETGTVPVCRDCSRGYYQPEAKQTTCIKCPEGSTTISTKSVSMASCTKTCESGSELQFPLTTCTACGLGKYRDKNKHTKCVTCPSPLTTKQVMSTSEQDCVSPCTSGQGYEKDTKTCKACVKGTYQPEPNQDKCLSCRKGTTTQNTGSTLETDCKDPCEAGKEYNGDECKACPKGTYKSGDMTTCQSCDVTETTSQDGSDSATDCQPICTAAMDITVLGCIDHGNPTDLAFRLQVEAFAEMIRKRFEGADSVSHFVFTDPSELLDDVKDKAYPSINIRPENTKVFVIVTLVDIPDTPLKNAINELRKAGGIVAVINANTALVATGTNDFGDIVSSPSLLFHEADFDTMPEYEAIEAALCIEPCTSGTERDAVSTSCIDCPKDSYRDATLTHDCVSCPAGKGTATVKATSLDQCLETPVCPLGYWLDAENCVPCPLNEYKDDKDAAKCTKCPDDLVTNAIATESLAECIADCKPGSKIVGKTCVKCSEGDYQSKPRQTSCDRCTLPKTTNQKGATSADDCKDPCPGGYEMNWLTQKCGLCKEDTFRVKDVDIDCQACPFDFIIPYEGAKSKAECQSLCSAGQYWDANASPPACKSCPLTKFQNLPGQFVCKDCPDTWVTLTVGAKYPGDCKVPCVPGQGWNGAQCYDCPAGKYQPDPNQMDCLDCPPHTTTLLNKQATCIGPCIAGKQLPVGATSPTACVDCVENTYKDNSMDKCKACPVGYTSGAGSDSIDDCKTPCKPGFFGFPCEPCPVGKYQDKPNMNSCEECPSGTTTVDVGSTECSVCPIGSFDCKETPPHCIDPNLVCEGDFHCQDSHLDEDPSVCVSCSRGMYHDGDSCEPCIIGTYQPDEGKTFCIDCPPGWTTVSQGRQVLSDCQAICPRGTWYTGSSPDPCEPCPIGTYQSNPFEDCTPCPNGYITADDSSSLISDCVECQLGYDFTAGDTSCKPCDQDYYRGTGMVKCEKCGAGTYSTGADTTCIKDCPPGQYLDNNVCKLCPVGQHQFLPRQTSCTNCAAGLTTTGEGADTVDRCYDKCPDGQELLSDGTCKDCDPGTVRKKNVDAACKSCPKSGYTTDKAVSVPATAADCLPNCVAGSYRDETMDACQKCNAASYQPDKYQTSCKPCPLGMRIIDEDEGATSVNQCEDPCNDGSDLKIGEFNVFTCEVCPAGEIKVKPNPVCVPCQPGYVQVGEDHTVCYHDCSSGSYWNGIKCELCRPNTYQPLPYKDTCIPCDVGLGTEFGHSGAVLKSECKEICPNGHELQFDGTCVKCEVNYYREAGVDRQCTSCPLYSMTLFPGAKTEAECVYNCTAGTHWNPTSSACEPCSPGSYTDKPYQMTCKLCEPAGKMTTINAQGEKIDGATSVAQCAGDCPEGKMWNAGTQTCDLCLAGTYTDKKYQTSCTKCGPGQTSLEGSSKKDDCNDPCGSGFKHSATTITTNQCVPCGKGWFRDRANDPVCKPCDPGLTTPDTTSATSESECKRECPPGSYSDAVLKSCVLCDIGYYQPLKDQTVCVKCDNDWITADTGNIDPLKCIPYCVEGEEYKNGRCQACPIGTYNDEKNRVNCIDCDAGKTTKQERSTSASQCITSSCTADQMLCKSGTGCATRCDDVDECTDHSDEYGCNCQSGYFFDISAVPLADECKQCDKGFYQPYIGKTFCNKCPYGTTTDGKSSVGKTMCKDICSEGKRFDGSTCIVCPEGTFREEGSPQLCVDCPTGYTSPAGSNKRTDCVPDCAAGHWFDKTCKPCPRDYYQPDPNQVTCKRCPRGMGTDGTGTTTKNGCKDVCLPGAVPQIFDCPDCPAVFSTLPPPWNCDSCSPTSTGPTLAPPPCVACPVGTYKLIGVNSIVCQQCDPGFTTATSGAVSIAACKYNCKAGAKIGADGVSCVPCSKGSYQDQPLQTSCKDCPAGLTTKYPAAATSAECKDLCNDGLELSPSKESCDTCDVGDYRTQAVHTECQKCPDGKTTNTIGSRDETACVNDCGIGTVYNKIKKACEKCAKGSYMNLPNQEGSCTTCPTGQTTNATGAVSPSDCTDVCVSGFVEDATSGVCSQCPRGTFRRHNLDTTCTACPSPFTTRSTGATGPDMCVPGCLPAEYFNVALDRCVTCATNTFNPNPYQFNCTQCPPDKPLSEDDHLGCKELCHIGASWNRALQRCNWCPEGSYGIYNKDDPNNAFGCTQCPGDKTTDGVGKTSITDCVFDCVPGEGANSITNLCNWCPRDFYQNAAKPHSEACKQCPAGTTTTAQGATACVSFSCTTLGQKWDVVTSQCQNCSREEYQDVPNQKTCKPCPDDKHTKYTGANNENLCQADWCDAGYKYNRQTDKCDECGKGYYRTIEDRVCLQCPTGKTTYTNTATSQAECRDLCPVGSYFDSSTVQCKLCGEGMYQDTPGQSSCKQCGGQLTSPSGATAASQCVPVTTDTCPLSGQEMMDGVCVDCRVGWYKDSTIHVHCQPCPDGHTTDTTRSTSSTDCKPLPPTTRPTPKTTPTPIPTPCTDCLDLVIVIDMSSSLETSECNLIKAYIKKLLQKFIISTKRTHVGVIQYARGVNTVLNVHYGYSYNRICNKIKDLRPSKNSDVNTHDGLHLARDMLKGQGRTKKGQHVLLITDDKASDLEKAVEERRKLELDGVKVTVIGTESSEVDVLSSEKFSGFWIPDYNSFPDCDRVVTSVCTKDFKGMK